MSRIDDLVHIRGERKKFTLYIEGDHSSRNLSFGVKKNPLDATDDLLLQKQKALNGLQEITAFYNSTTKKTTCEFYIEVDDASDLEAYTYRYDLDSIDPNNLTDVQKVKEGNFTLKPGVQNRNSGTDLPKDGQRYIPLLVILTGDKQILQYSENEKTAYGVDPGKLISDNYYNKDEMDSKELALQQADASLTNGKVDKIEGKGLSTEDFASTEKNKLSTVEANAASLATVKHDADLANAITTSEYSNALFDLLLNGNLDEMNTILNIDLNKSLIRIGVL